MLLVVKVPGHQPVAADWPEGGESGIRDHYPRTLRCGWVDHQVQRAVSYQWEPQLDLLQRSDREQQGGWILKYCVETPNKRFCERIIFKHKNGVDDEFPTIWHPEVYYFTYTTSCLLTEFNLKPEGLLSCKLSSGRNLEIFPTMLNKCLLTDISNHQWDICSVTV